MRSWTALVMSLTLALSMPAAAHDNHQKAPPNKAAGTTAISTPGPNGATPAPPRSPVPVTTIDKAGATATSGAGRPAAGTKTTAAPSVAAVPLVPAVTPAPSKPVKPLTLDDVNKGFKLMKEDAGASCSIACANGNHSIACKVGQSCNCSCPGGFVSCHCE